ncbi:hypothetical protein ACQPZF_11230 [Actinosynnema sp. CS-041913]
MTENALAADLQPEPDDLDRIAAILPTGGYGARYIDEHMPTWQ